MAKKNNKNSKKLIQKEKTSFFALPKEIKKLIFGILMFLLAIIFGLSFFELSGAVGKWTKILFFILVGNAIFVFPLVFILAGFSFLYSKKKFIYPFCLATFFFILGISGIFEVWKPGLKEGGYLGYMVGRILVTLFGSLVAQIIFLSLLTIGLIIFWQLLFPFHLRKKEVSLAEKPLLAENPLPKEEKKSIITRFFGKKERLDLKMKEIEPHPKIVFFKPQTQKLGELKLKPLDETKKFFYQPPPLNLLEKEKETPNSGDIKINSAIIKKTLQNFNISVEMSEVNVGPTVTQYTLKPAEGIKLSKITTLSNDLSLALASHPIRIEAPIPGRSLVGVEVPNKVRAKVRLQNLLATDEFQKSVLNLTIALGKDVSGVPVYADLAKMPHFLVAGSTGAGKSVFLNSLILSLIYRSPNTLNPFGGSPEILRFILIDPKRVEFPVYNDLPHLLCPVIYDFQKAINALKWVISEMDRRFGLLSEVGARDILSYNKKMDEKKEKPLPYIVLIIDELADLMAARGKEVEGNIVRIAQMARAVGIHLVLATQRPSVEVITGLIKANITARVAFQVASQIDSRTILDTAGAEKLLGLGDLLFISAEVAKPKRIQSAFVSEQEVKRVVEYLKSKFKKEEPDIEERSLAESLEMPSPTDISTFQTGESKNDPLYEEAKRVVLEARKASASLLQRRLRVGYARAARLLDLLEENGVVGPADGAKPREVLVASEEENDAGGWKKV